MGTPAQDWGRSSGKESVAVTTRVIVIPEDLDPVSVLGPDDAVIRKVEQAFPLVLTLIRGNRITLQATSGAANSQAAQAQDLIDSLIGAAYQAPLDAGQVEGILDRRRLWTGDGAVEVGSGNSQAAGSPEVKVDPESPRKGDGGCPAPGEGPADRGPSRDGRRGLDGSRRGGDDIGHGREHGQAAHALSGQMTDRTADTPGGRASSGGPASSTPPSDTMPHADSSARSGHGGVLPVRGAALAYSAKGPIRPKTAGQVSYINAITTHTITFGIGPAGTGKTYLAVAKAVQSFRSKQVSRIILTRPAVEAGESLGFLPGSLTDKVDPYLRPLYDALSDMLGPEHLRRHLADGTIEVAPLAYMRGRTLNDAFVILDEAQNTTRQQMKMFLTRLGFNTRMVITGDVTQVDLGLPVSGLATIEPVLGRIDDIAFVHLGAADVVRHRLVGEIVQAYERADRVRRTRRGEAGRTPAGDADGPDGREPAHMEGGEGA